MMNILQRRTRGRRASAPEGPDARDMKRLRFMAERLIGNIAEVHSSDTEAYCAFMQHGDPVADAVADWMAETGFQAGMQQFERALVQGIAAVHDAPACLQKFFETVERRPDWVEDALLLQGARAIHRGGIALPFLLGDVFLLGGYSVSVAMNQALVMTGGLREGSARKRAVETAAWWLDVTAAGGMAWGAPGHLTTVRVRLLHAVMRRRLGRDPSWHHELHGAPINQAHMASTGHAFGIGCLLAARAIGVRFSPEERRAVIHLWRYANWLMGVDDALNPATEREAVRILLLSAMTAPRENDLATELAGSYLTQVQYRFPRLGPAGGVLSRTIGNGRLGLARLVLGRKTYRKLALPEGRAWTPLTVAAIGVLNARETVRRLVPGTGPALARAGRRLQELQVDLLRDAGDAPDRFVPYEHREDAEPALRATV